MRLNPLFKSPDPTLGHESELTPNAFGGWTMRVYPHRLVNAIPDHDTTRAWGSGLELMKRLEPFQVQPGSDRIASFIFDFGTELHATLSLEIETPGLCNITATFGEILPEVDGVICGSLYPVPTEFWHIPSKGRHSRRFDKLHFPERELGDGRRGFRFVALRIHDLSGPVKLMDVHADADFSFRQRKGFLKCEDSRFQQVWETSLYTARLCTQPDTFWDGIKRDRVGWFGDARVIKEAVDPVFFDPIPSEKMLGSIPVDDWANGIPNYSFDGIAMLKSHILRFGLVECATSAYERMATFMKWAIDTQTDVDGFIIRTERQFFFDIGFVDWSPMPVGGRFEELCWLQCKFVEALRALQWIAHAMKRPDDANAWGQRANKISTLIVDRFWCEGVGFLHTLNHVGPVGNPILPGGDGHYKRTYLEKIALGPSGPTRQANALAILAGVATPQMRDTLREAVFGNPAVPEIITPYFTYYEQLARALCGDKRGALLKFRDYLGEMIDREDAATVWELYDVNVRDMRRYCSSQQFGFPWPLSYCHGWGAGAVPCAFNLLAGVEAVGPGFSKVTLAPCLDIQWAFEAEIPTPHGAIAISGDGKTAHYRMPEDIGIEGGLPAGVTMTHYHA